MTSIQNRFSNFCQEFLVGEFNRRKERNASYSMRAFARDIGIAKTNVSAVLNGLRKLSRSNVAILATSLNLDEETLEKFKKDLKRSARSVSSNKVAE